MIAFSGTVVYGRNYFRNTCCNPKQQRVESLPMKKRTPTPTQAAKLHGIRTYGAWRWLYDTDLSNVNVVRAFVAGARWQKRKGKR